MTSLVVYITQWCGHCKTELPSIRESAHKLGYSVSVVDVDRCPVNLKQKCQQVDFVPTVTLNGKEISVQQLKQMASER